MWSSQAALCGLTGSRLTSACQMLSAGKTGQLVPGRFRDVGPGRTRLGNGLCRGEGEAAAEGMTARAAHSALAVTTPAAAAWRLREGLTPS